MKYKKYFVKLHVLKKQKKKKYIVSIYERAYTKTKEKKIYKIF